MNSQVFQMRQFLISHDFPTPLGVGNLGIENKRKKDKR